MIRPATAADAAGCAALYASYVSGSAISFETTPPGAAELERRIEAAHLWLVAEEDGELAGYACGSRHREREAYRWAADVAIYVERSRQGRGLGRRLYSTLFDGLRELGLCVLCAGVTLPNAASEALHESMGFSEVGVYRRIGFKLGRWHDVRWYQLELRPVSYLPAETPIARS